MKEASISLTLFRPRTFFKPRSESKARIPKQKREERRTDGEELARLQVRNNPRIWRLKVASHRGKLLFATQPGPRDRKNSPFATFAPLNGKLLGDALSDVHLSLNAVHTHARGVGRDRRPA